MWLASGITSAQMGKTYGILGGELCKDETLDKAFPVLGSICSQTTGIVALSFVIWVIRPILPHLALADVVNGIPDSAPAGFDQWTSPIVLPAPNTTGQNGWASSVARARAFVAQLTLAEKINVTTGVDTGASSRCLGNTGTILCLHDSPIGVRLTDFVSAFPAGINAASTWDRDLIEKRGYAMGSEHKGKGVNIVLGPGTNLARVAAAGRNWEAFGADPFLAGVATAASIEGYQSAGVIAGTHFCGGSEAKQVESSNIDDRTLHEVYVWPFAEAVKVGVAAVMCSYNYINQTQACQNSKLINGVLKEELGFQGFIMSDWAAMINGLQPALAGLDMNMPGFIGYGIGDQDQPDPSTATNSWWGSELSTMVNNGSLSETRIDDMVTRIFAAWYQLGQDEDYPHVSFTQHGQQTFSADGQLVNEHVNVQGEHYRLIREIGAASSILLKNTKNALPLRVKNLKRIGIFGSDAAANPDGANNCAGGATSHGCSQGTLAQGWGSGTAYFPYLVDPLSAIGTHIRSINPTVVVDAVTNDFNLKAVSDAASLADTCLVFVNADSGEGYITVDGNAGDRNNITLWHGGDNLILTTASRCANTIVVAHIVGPVLVESWIDHPNVTAFINAGIPGQESDEPEWAVAYTMAKTREDYNADVLYTSSDPVTQITYEEALEIDYRHFDAHDIEPRFEFGFGLSYTTFVYSGLETAPHPRRDADHTTTSAPGTAASPVNPVGGPTELYDVVATVSFTIKNTGPIAGNEVPQLYLGFPASVNEPPKVLRGFTRKLIAAGSETRVALDLRRKDVSVWDVVRQDWVVPEGRFEVMVGSSSRDIKLTGSLEF
ncbi:glycoside hydrolase superfamily [Roridomyces roridus]|uniref:beta-glucosidase n=1 Tax=Roridomyces roridus TaxID=1738132 RepID=A0AAD7B5I9_9AGAR|nr:glycoside hydrolase superfamily [Roridomyces roridus]